MTSDQAISQAKAALRAVVSSRGKQANALDEVTRKALLAFGLVTDIERALFEESRPATPRATTGAV